MLAESLLVALGLFSFHPTDVSIQTSLPQLPVARYVAPEHVAPIRRDASSAGIQTTGKAAMLMDVKSGAVLFERNSDQAFAIASITKLMTAMVVLDAKLPMDEEITLIKDDLPSEGRAELGVDQVYTRDELLHALLIGSVNMAGNALARTYPGGTEAFIQAMNAKAQEMSLSTAVFHDPTGLNSANVASASDVAHMLQRALNYAEIREITKLNAVSMKDHKTGKVTDLTSTNLLLDSFLNKKPYSIIAAKTGSLPEAGFCLAQATQDENGDELIAVTLGSENHFARYQDVKALTAWGFDAFQWEN